MEKQTMVYVTINISPGLMLERKNDGITNNDIYDNQPFTRFNVVKKTC